MDLSESTRGNPVRSRLGTVDCSLQLCTFSKSVSGDSTNVGLGVGVGVGVGVGLATGVGVDAAVGVGVATDIGVGDGAMGGVVAIRIDLVFRQTRFPESF
ncbi:MAG: hypothetical protein FJW46_06935 [Actinobacteria bacterium]|nr:hypothetical protein [Actinomycetota bacterium]